MGVRSVGFLNCDRIDSLEELRWMSPGPKIGLVAAGPYFARPKDLSKITLPLAFTYPL